MSTPERTPADETGASGFASTAADYFRDLQAQLDSLPPVVALACIHVSDDGNLSPEGVTEVKAALEAMTRVMDGLNLYPNGGLELREVLAREYDG